MDNFLARPARYASRLGQLVGQYEKFILAALAVVIVISGTFWYRQFSQNYGTGPNTGGSYVEGLVEGETELQQAATRLTKVGLFGFEADGRLKNILVKEWRVNPEKTEYVFVLKEEIEKNEILTDLQTNLGLLGPSTIDLNEAGELVISLNAPNPNLPIVLSQPMFDYGPYKLGKTTEKTTIFTRNTREGAVQPYLNKIVIHSYANKDLLKQALDKNKLDGALGDNITTSDRYALQTIELPRYYTVLFNVNKSPFRDVSARRAIIDEARASGIQFTLTVADQEPNKTLATDLVKRWGAQGANVTLDVKPVDEVQDKIAPSRNFQALLTGIDYGVEYDPYYLWDSSQLRPPGNNLTGVKNEAIDAHVQAIRNTTNIKERETLIKTLHELLNREAVAFIIRQETANFILANRMVFQDPPLAQNITDRYRSIASWYIK